MKTRLAVTLGLALLTPAALAGEALIAVAANFATPLQRLASDFAKTSVHTLQIAPESTGKLYAQIHHGAPYDVLLAADQATPQRLASEGHALPDTQFTYGVGQLVLWSSTPGSTGTLKEVLTDSQAKHLAIANPKTAPYGSAAVSVLKNMGLYERWQPRLVQGENITQTLQFVSTGNAAMGFVAMSQVMQNGKFTQGSGWVVDQALYPAIKQDAILLKKGEHNAAATAFLAYLKSPPARQLIRQYGYEVNE